MLLNNEKTVARLFTAASGALSHAYVFSGPKGSGKKTLAGIFTQAILCQNSTKPCGNCVSCKMLESSSHPDIITISPSGAAQMIKVDDIRAMRKECYIKPIIGDRRVIIIEKAHAMNVNSQNALLKILEEPPEGTVILLLTDRLSKLLPTIRSRAAIVTMSLPNKEALTEHLKGFEGASTTVSAQSAVDFSSGIAGQAIDVMNSDNNSPYFIAQDFMSALVGNYLYDFLLLRDRLSVNREHYANSLNAIVKFCSDICSYMSGISDNLHFDSIKVATVSKKLTKAKTLNIIDMLRSSNDTVDLSAVDLRVAATNMLLQCWEGAHR